MENIKRLSDRKRGFSSLENISNTCYMNSIIQCLSNNHPFRQYVTELDPETKFKVLYHFTNLIKGMWKGNYKITPTNFYKSFIAQFPQYKVHHQHDARDFLFDLLTEVSSSLEQKCIGITPSVYSNKHYINALQEWRNYFENKSSHVIDNFYGQYLKKFTCSTCSNIYYKYDVFLTINIDAIEASVEDLIYSGLSLDYINGTCENCIKDFEGEDLDDIPDHLKNPEHSIETLLYKLPQTLIVSVNCFNSSLQKIYKQVKINETIDLYKKFVCNTDEVCVYKLSSIVYHQGDLNSGHYFTVVFKDDKYHIFNDHEIQKDVNISKIKSIPYIIMYEKMNTK
jgi:ubiquitin C-terminal hydrolase